MVGRGDLEAVGGNEHGAVGALRRLHLGRHRRHLQPQWYGDDFCALRVCRVPKHRHIFANGRDQFDNFRALRRLYVGGERRYLQPQLGCPRALNEYVGWQSPGVFTQTGGTNTAGGILLGYVSSGTYNLNGGVLDVSNIEASTNGTFNLGGGTLLAGEAFSTSQRLSSAATPQTSIRTATR